MPVNNYNYGRPDFRLKYRWNSDTPPTLPIAPRNVNVTSPYLIGVIDIRWDDPSTYIENNGLSFQGVNVYRAFDSPEAPYTRLNTTPLGSLFYRDQTREITVTAEDPMVGGRIIMGTNATGDWVIKTFYQPIIIPGSNGELAHHPKHVTLQVSRFTGDPFVTVPAFKVIGETGEVFMIKSKVYNHSTNRLEDPILPNANAGGQVRISYNYIDNWIQTDINRKIYYKVSSVVVDPDTGDTKETPLNEVEAFSPYDMEKIDWVWAEAIRRNRWILEQGGERVKLFSRKWAGTRCPCYVEEYRRSKEDCLLCLGTSYVGGYEGPYDIIVAPPETEKMVNLMDAGLHVSYDWNSWTGPYPLLNDRDFIIRANNDRFSIARVNPQGSRGAIYQQHFNLSPLDQRDIRYKVPVTGGATSVPEEWNAYREEQPTDASPVITNKPEVEDQHEYRGRTVTFENITY